MKKPLSKTIHLVWPNDKNLGSAVLPPLGIGYLASYLVDKGFDVKIHDSTFSKRFFFDKERAIYGIAIDTPILNVAEVAIKRIKKANKDNLIVAGGPHATTLPHSLMENKLVDYLTVGEAEETFHSLCDALLKGKPVKDIKGVYYRKGKKVVFTGPAPMVKDLDALPFPRYDLFPIDDYLGYKPIKELNMITSRGCPFDCIYCQPYLHNTFGRNIRFRSPKNVVDEMMEVKKKYKPHIIFFCDDFVNAKYTRELCEEIIRRKVNIFWRCQARACLSKDVLKLMKKAGCMNIAFGVESGSQKVLNAINKKIKLDQVKKQFEDCRKIGMFAHAFLMVGSPTENWEDVRKTISFVDEIKPFSIYVCITTPYPGTHLFNKLLRENKLPKDIDWLAMHHFRDDAFHGDISEMSEEDVVKAKYLILSKFKKSSKLARAAYLTSYLGDGVGALKVASFVLGNPKVTFEISKALLFISKTGSGLHGTNPESDFFDIEKSFG